MITNNNLKLTKAQQDAIDKGWCFTNNKITRKNILVSAAAGSGKTMVLAERIIDKIMNYGINIDEFLVVTFTESAAFEMKERIIKKINKNLDETPNKTFLLSQLTRINRAQISTIDAFCYKIVKQNFKFLDLDPNFKIGDPSELVMLRAEVLDEFLDIYYSKNDDEFINLIEAFSKNSNDEEFKSIFLKIYNNAQNVINFENWFDVAMENFNISTKESLFSSNIFLRLIKDITKLLTEFMLVFEIIKDTSYPTFDFTLNSDKEKSLEKFLIEEFSNYQTLLDLLKNKQYLDFSNFINIVEFKRFPSISKEHKNLRDEILKKRNLIKKIFQDIKKEFFIKSIDEILEDNIKIQPIINMFCKLIKEFDKYFMDIKKSKNMFTFSDISHFSLKILQNEDISSNYRSLFKETIIDEYQDSNSIQEAILSYVSNSNRFMVGDIKQCIYRFRQANPNIFNEKFTEYQKIENENIRIDLNYNFRSSKNVINAINTIFKPLMSNSLGEVLYDKFSQLNIPPNALDDELLFGKCELNILDTSYDNKEKIEDEELEKFIELENQEFEANFICTKIQDMINNSKKDLIEPIKYNDIVILMRDSKAFDVFSKVFTENNIPLYTKLSNNFYDFTEVTIICNILKIVDNPYQDIALIGTMYSPIFNFSANDLLEIKLLSEHKLFFECILHFIDNGSNISLIEKCSTFLGNLKNWQVLSKTFSISELLSNIYTSSNFFNYIGVLEKSKVRQSNLLTLLEKSITFEQNNGSSLFKFISFIDKLKSFNQDGEAPTFSDDENVVKMMTIHKSKGLEFPIVFVANLKKNFNISDNKANIIFDEEFNLGVSVILPNKKLFENENINFRKKINSFQKSVIKSKQLKELYSEEIRILYVALTRAKKKLILLASINKNFDKTLENFEDCALNVDNKILSNIFIKNSKSNNFLCWVYTAIKNFDSKKNWDINIIKNLLHNKTKDIEQKLVRKNDILNDILNIKCSIKNKSLDWQYKNIDLQKINSTLTVSDIKDNNTETSLELPNFYTLANNISNLQIGTIYHKIFEHMNFNILNQDKLDKFLNNFVINNILKQVEIDCIDKCKISDFLNSDLCTRLKNAISIYRETPFDLQLKISDVYPEYKDNQNFNNENILIYGIIDLYFEEKDGLVLVEYKTDKMLLDNLFIEKYKIQLNLYKLALEKYSNKKVKECIIYSVNSNKCIVL